MKKVIKIFSIIIALFFIIIIGLSILAKLKEKEIADFALQKISKSIKAPIKIGNISLNLLKKFPLATLEFEDIWLGSSDSLNNNNPHNPNRNTLVNIEKLYVSVKTKPLFNGLFEIMKVEIKGAEINYIIDRHGISNFDFLTDSTNTDTSSSGLNIILKELSLRDIHCNYYDSLNLTGAQIEISKTKARGEVRDDYIKGSAKGLLKLAKCNYKSSPLNLIKEIVLNFDLDYANDTMDVNKLFVSLDGANFKLYGSTVLRDTIESHLKIEGKDLNLGKLIKYVPKQTIKDIGLKNVSGLLNFKASIDGLLSDSILPNVKIDVVLKNAQIEDADYPAISNVSFTGFLTNGKLNNKKTTSVTLSNFHAESGNSSCDMNINLKNLNHIQYTINSSMDIDLVDFKKYITDSIITDIKGHVDAKLSTEGVLPDSIDSEFIDYVLGTSKLDLLVNNLCILTSSGSSFDSLSGQLIFARDHFVARNLELYVPTYNIKFFKTFLDGKFLGKFSQPESFGIDMTSFQIKTDSCSISGSLKIRNFKTPDFILNSNIGLNLNELDNYLSDTLVKNLSGKITAQIASKGKLNLDSLSIQINELIFKNSSFKANFENVSFDTQDTLLGIKKFSGKLSMKSDTIEINNTHGIYNGIDFCIDSTKVINLYNSVIKNQVSQLYVEGRFNLGKLNYTMFVPFILENADSSSENLEKTTKDANSESINYSYLFKGKIRIESFTYKNAVAEKISSLFSISDSLYLIDQFKFNAFGGRHNTSVRYSIRKKEKLLSVKNSVEEMDVHKLLKDFDNFSEYYEPSITSEHVTGLLSSKFDSQILFINDSLIRNKLYVRCEIKLEKGGIFNYKPLQDMAQYLPGVDNLDKLEFKTINSNIFVFQDAIFVPSTLIVSNKLDARAFGMKSFGENYDYHFEVFLSDLLTGKSKKINKKQNEMGDVVSDAGRNGILVRSYSKDGKNHNERDKKEDNKIMRERINISERQLILRFYPNSVTYNTGVN